MRDGAKAASGCQPGCPAPPRPRDQLRHWEGVSTLSIQAGGRLPLSLVSSQALGSRVEMDAARGTFQCYQHSAFARASQAPASDVASVGDVSLDNQCPRVGEHHAGKEEGSARRPCRRTGLSADEDVRGASAADPARIPRPRVSRDLLMALRVRGPAGLQGACQTEIKSRLLPSPTSLLPPTLTLLLP
ncbi:unnamed protein product [Rangifer tarandus platyrhynchus]|uniref:Uncharacterized protein n=1 Tax=Rangifer tarandus platyrhynchus TaxID=3082113 RepID=A0AC59ZN17_RANTA